MRWALGDGMGYLLIVTHLLRFSILGMLAIFSLLSHTWLTLAHLMVILNALCRGSFLDNHDGWSVMLLSVLNPGGCHGNVGALVAFWWGLSGDVF